MIRKAGTIVKWAGICLWFAGCDTVIMVSIEAQAAPLSYTPWGASESVVDPLFHALTSAVTAWGGRDFYILGQDGQWWPIAPDWLACAKVLYNAPQNYNMYIGPLISVG